MALKRWQLHLLSWIWGPVLAVQFVLVFFLGRYNLAAQPVLLWAGWIIWGISLVMGWWPILALKRKGGVGKGRSYVHTTTMVDTGLYAIVRHPQYTAGILLSLALMLIGQNWLITSMTVVVVPLLYWDIVIADQHEIEKFGERYQRYMPQVPRTNFLLGIIRLVKRSKH